jgi:hypothetical protein
MGPIPSMSLSACAKATPRIRLGRDLLSAYGYQKPWGMGIRSFCYGPIR